MKKFYATEPITVEGKRYNRGDIVWTNKKVNSLRAAETEADKVPVFKRLPVSEFVGLDNPIVSVVLTFHNQENFVRDCLDSFMRQTLEVPYEIIAVDDSSTDATTKIIKEEYPQVRYIRINGKHACRARNAGLDDARGRYIAFFDGDDWAYPNYLEELHSALRKNPEYGFSYSRFQYGDKKSFFQTCNFLEWGNYVEYRSVVNTPTMIRAEYAKQVRWDDNVTTGQDRDYSLGLYKLGAKGFHVRKKLWFYREHGASMWGSNKGRKKFSKDHAYIQEKYNLPMKQLDHTLVSLISREYCLEAYFENLRLIDMPQSEMHWLVVIETEDNAFVEKVKSYLEGFEFATTRVFVTNRPPITNNRMYKERTMRIAENYEVILQNVSGMGYGTTKYVFVVEDDTLPKHNAFNVLLKHLQSDDRIVFAQGVETHRHGYRRIGGGTLTMRHGVPISKYNPPYREEGVEDINIGGWFCFMGRVDVLSKIPFRSIPEYLLGPDEMFVYDIVSKGHRCIMDWSVPCIHLNEDGEVFYPKDCKEHTFKYRLENDKVKIKVTHGK